MKRKIVAVLASAACVTALAYLALGQVLTPQKTPAMWVDSTGTNWALLTASGPTWNFIRGTNVTSAVTTNMAVTNALRLNIVNGTIVGITY
jgi:hypothetical protein